MKKPFTHTDLNMNVRCSYPHCAKVHGIEGVVQQPIKKNVIARSPNGEKDTFVCYPCQLYIEDGLTLAERKANKNKKAQSVPAGQRVLTAETT